MKDEEREVLRFSPERSRVVSYLIRMKDGREGERV